MLVYIQFPSFLYEFNENHEYSSSPVTAWMAKIGPSIQFSARKIELKFKKFIRKHKRILHILGLSATPCVYLVSLPPIQFNPIQSNPNGRRKGNRGTWSWTELNYNKWNQLFCCGSLHQAASPSQPHVSAKTLKINASAFIDTNNNNY